MEPPLLSSPPALALHWQEVLRRDGFRVSSGDDVLRGEIHHQRHRHALKFTHITAEDCYVFDLSSISDERVRGRLELIFLSSGAAYNLDAFEPSPCLLYRNEAEHSGGTYPDEEIDRDVVDALQRREVTVALSVVSSFGGGAVPETEPHLSGVISRGRQGAEIETGPALDPAHGARRRLVWVRPRALFRFGDEMLALLRDTDDALRGLGATPILTLRILEDRG